MGREHKVISALQETPVPVPPVVGLCEDESVNGAPFYVMEFVEGPILRSAEDAEAFDEDARRAIGERVVDTLVAIHEVDPDAVGLGELGRKEDYVERQLKRWQGQWEKSKTRELPGCRRGPRAARGAGPRAGAGDDRPRRLPPRQHDPRAGAGEVAAVVDWELCTLGDPLADVGLLLVYWSEPGDEFMPLFAPATIAPGFPSREEVQGALRRALRARPRARSTSSSPSATGSWRSSSRASTPATPRGQYGKTDEGFEEFARIVERLADAADAAEKRLA